ncbi:MAG: caspase family protein, partial [Lewinella sp.]
MAKLYALLVGIDDYPVGSGLARLRGCGNDVDEWAKIVGSVVPGRTVELQVLKNEAATYAALVAGLARRVPELDHGDHFCFVFCGHGSREPAAEVFRDYFPERLQETLVCYDSRLPGGLELADKELTYLLQDIAERGADITVILDCCHSGSGTRGFPLAEGMLVRQAPDNARQRPVESYLDGRLARELANSEGNFRLPRPRHILFSACRRHETAGELSTGRGLLSYAAEIVIRSAEGRLSNIDLHRRLAATVLGSTDRQHPALECAGGADAFAGFLGSELTDLPSLLPVTRTREGEWSVPLGAAQGLAGAVASDLHFQLFRDDEPWKAVVAESIGFDRTILSDGGNVPTKETVTARLLSAPPVSAFVYCGAKVPYRSVLTEKSAQRPSAFYTLSEKARRAPYRLEERSAGVAIIRDVDKTMVYGVRGKDAEQVARAILAKLEMLLRWEYFIELGKDRVRADTPRVEILVEVQRNDNWFLLQESRGQVNVDMPQPATGGATLPFRISVRNTHPHRKIHVALFVGTEGFGLHDTEYNEPLAAGETAIAWDSLQDGTPTRFESIQQPEKYYT